MRQIQLTSIITLLIFNLTFGQSIKEQWLINKFRDADSIVLVSHDLVFGSTDVAFDNGGKIIPFPNLLNSGRPNESIIKEQQLIKGKQVDLLIRIMSRTFKGSAISQGGCFVPRQAIFLFKDGRTSFVDICFHCNSYKTSDDLIDIPPFDSYRWKKLKKYFMMLGFKYGLE